MEKRRGQDHIDRHRNHIDVCCTGRVKMKHQIISIVVSCLYCGGRPALLVWLSVFGSDAAPPIKCVSGSCGGGEMILLARNLNGGRRLNCYMNSKMLVQVTNEFT